MANALFEVALSWLLANVKGHDDRCFYTGPAFAAHPAPTVTVTSPVYPSNSTTNTTVTVGGSGSNGSNATTTAVAARLGPEHTADGAGQFPALRWEAPPAIAGQVREWLLLSEDPDAPLPTPIAHGVYAGIPSAKTSVEAADFALEDASRALLKGGFHYGKARGGGPYLPPRPLMNHGPHRYFFQVVALSEPLDSELLNATVTREQLADVIAGKVLGWGLWVGVAERKWE